MSCASPSIIVAHVQVCILYVVSSCHIYFSSHCLRTDNCLSTITMPSTSTNRTSISVYLHVYNRKSSTTKLSTVALPARNIHSMKASADGVLLAIGDDAGMLEVCRLLLLTCVPNYKWPLKDTDEFNQTTMESHSPLQHWHLCSKSCLAPLSSIYHSQQICKQKPIHDSISYNWPCTTGESVMKSIFFLFAHLNSLMSE